MSKISSSSCDEQIIEILVKQLASGKIIEEKKLEIMTNFKKPALEYFTTIVNYEELEGELLLIAVEEMNKKIFLGLINYLKPLQIKILSKVI